MVVTEEVEGLSAALRRGEEDLRYPLGPAQPVTDLAQEFAHSANHRRKISDLSRHGYGHMRRVRGDGNCFYRAAGFAWLEALDALPGGSTSSSAPPPDVLPSGWPDEAGFGSLAAEYKELRQEVRRMPATSAGSSRALLKRILCDVRLDLCLVVLVRRIVAGFLQRGIHKASDDAAAAILEAVTAEHGSPMNFATAQVLPLGREAEGAAIVVAARELGARLRIVQLDGTSRPMASYVYPSEDYVSRLGVRICLLFRPGHYEVLYREDAPRLQEISSLRGTCSFCRDSASLPPDGLLVCFHRLCGNCLAQARTMSSNLQCPICSEVPLPLQGRTARQPQTTLDLPKEAPSSVRPPATARELTLQPEQKVPFPVPTQPCLHAPELPKEVLGYAQPPMTVADLRQPPMTVADLRYGAESEPLQGRLGGVAPGGSVAKPLRSEGYLLKARRGSKSSLGGDMPTTAPGQQQELSSRAALAGSALTAAALGLDSGRREAVLERSSTSELRGHTLPQTSRALQQLPMQEAAGRSSPSSATPSSAGPSPSSSTLRHPRTSMLQPSKPGRAGGGSPSGGAACGAASPPPTWHGRPGAAGARGASPPRMLLPPFSAQAAGQWVPQTEDSLSCYRGGASPSSPATLRCCRCGEQEHLRSVRCCGGHYCHACLAVMIANLRAGAVLSCAGCKAALDLELLSRAWKGGLAPPPA